MRISHFTRLFIIGIVVGSIGVVQSFAAEPMHHGEGAMGSLPSRKIVGATVENSKGEKIGTIEDIVIDTDSNKVAYAALGVGGVFGLGERLFAIPMEEFKFTRDSSNNPIFVIDVTKERLEKAPGFDKNNWPDFGKPEWRNEVNDYYRHH